MAISYSAREQRTSTKYLFSEGSNRRNRKTAAHFVANDLLLLSRVWTTEICSIESGINDKCKSTYPIVISNSKKYWMVSGSCILFQTVSEKVVIIVLLELRWSREVWSQLQSAVLMDLGLGSRNGASQCRYNYHLTIASREQWLEILTLFPRRIKSKKWIRTKILADHSAREWNELSRPLERKGWIGECLRLLLIKKCINMHNTNDVPQRNRITIIWLQKDLNLSKGRVRLL